LLVVIAIIGLLTGIVFTNLSPAKSRARDAKRISDLGQIQLALELYFDRCKEYPETPPDSNSSIMTDPAFVNTANNCPSGSEITFKSFINQIPLPPLPHTADYTYIVDDQSKPMEYVLHTTLENENEITRNGMNEIDRNKLGYATDVTCYSSTDPKQYCLVPK
ncbi:MAG: type II secretion system GspH family protein, partial [bacterium]|nr:type II secretion system GspH family protein [bacterium]